MDWSVKAVFSNAGQVCLAGSRLYVQRGIYAEFLDRFVAAAQALAAGDPKDPATQLGLGREGGNFSREFFTEPKAVVIQV